MEYEQNLFPVLLKIIISSFRELDLWFVHRAFSFT